MDSKFTPYQPSNGTEGTMFCESWCERCIHEHWMHTQKDGDKQCSILTASMLYDVTDAEYPKELQYSQKTGPVCTAFKEWNWGSPEDGLNYPPEPEIIDPAQLSLF